LPPLFVLVHSPLVGPLTWSLVANELRGRGRDAIAPSLFDASCDDRPYWRRHVSAVAKALEGLPNDRALALVAHSGAGPILPSIGHATGRPIAGCLFVDAALPGRDGQSRLDLFEQGEADRFRASAAGGMIPPAWRDDSVLAAAGIADAELRRRFAAEVPDVPLAVYDEPLPVPASWPDALCSYLRFSAPYENEVRRAVAFGWPTRRLEGGHFHMLTEPVAVADALLDFAREMGI
jgi:hypothetical protein